MPVAEGGKIAYEDNKSCFHYGVFYCIKDEKGAKTQKKGKHHIERKSEIIVVKIPPGKL